MGIDPTSITDDDTFILSDGNAIIDGKFVLLDEDDPRRKEKQENKMGDKITPPKYDELSDEEKLPQSEIDFYDQIKSSGENLKKDYNYKSEINNINFNDNWDFSYTDKKSGITTFGSDEQINKNVNENENLIKENKEI